MQLPEPQSAVKPCCSGRIRLKPVNCLRCTTKQIGQLIRAPQAQPTVHHRQMLTELAQLQQQSTPHEQQPCHQLQPLLLQQHRSHPHVLQQLPQSTDAWQLAWANASSSSSSIGDATSCRGGSFGHAVAQQHKWTCLGAMPISGGSSSTGNSDEGPVTASNRSSSGDADGSDAAAVAGLPPLSSLLSTHTTPQTVQYLVNSNNSNNSSSSQHDGSKLAGMPANSSLQDDHLITEVQLVDHLLSATGPGTSAAGQGGQHEADSSGHEDSPGVKAALAMLKWYKVALSPLMQSVCRFQPTCSQYSMDSYQAYGVAKGTVLTAWRLLRCNPWGGSGYDPTTWPPPKLAWAFQLQYSAEVAVVLGAAVLFRFSHALLFE